MISSPSLQGSNSFLFDLFTNLVSNSEKIRTDETIDSHFPSEMVSEVEEPSVIDPIDDSILSNDKSDLEISPNKTTLSFSEISVTPTNDSLIINSPSQLFKQHSVRRVSHMDIEKIVNEEMHNSGVYETPDSDDKSQMIKELNDSLTRRVLKECFDLPEVLYACFQRSIFNFFYNNQTDIPILCADFKHFYQDYMLGCTNEDIVFSFLSHNKSTITRDDLLFFVSSIVPIIPSLNFLLSNQSLLTMYVNTVAILIEIRIADGNNEITKTQFKSSSLLQTLFPLTEESYDLSIDPFFSYEATYVLWYLFNDLDINHDMVLTIEELRRYEDISFTELTLSQIMKNRGTFSDDIGNYVIDYREFVYLVVADESRRCRESMLYWFSIIDLDLKGVIDESCIYSFYRSQRARLEEYGIDCPSFELYLASFSDLMGCKKNEFTLTDFIPTEADIQVATINKSVAIDLLVNTVKFLQFEHRDPTRMIDFDYNNPEYCDWNRFVSTNYQQMASSEDCM